MSLIFSMRRLAAVVLGAAILLGTHAVIATASDDASIEALEKVVRDDPSDYRAWFRLGVANGDEQRFNQAIKAFRKVIELRPDLAEPHNNLAVIYNETGDLQAAVDELEISLAKKPGYAIAEENIGDLYVKLALQHYRKALDGEPSAQLEQRYARLMQVRDPAAVAAAEKSGGRISEAAGKPSATGEQVSMDAVREEVLRAVERWRAAWERQDLEAYFAAYAPGYDAGNRFATLDDWKRYKRRVIGSKAWIRVELNDIEVTADAQKGTAEVKFFQKFSSDSYNGDDSKRLGLILDAGAWKIVSEVSAR